MKELGEALNFLFTKIGDFFDILDLSFFVSGITCVAALVAGAQFSGTHLLQKLQGTPAILLGLLACYVAGCLCFALGRWVREASKTSESKMLESTLAAHGLSDRSPFCDYLNRDEGAPRLYVRLWAEVRQAGCCAPSFTLLRRYWVMAATYDGLAVAMVVWSMVIALLTWSVEPAERLFPPLAGALAITFLLFLAATCLREASRYNRNQVEELVATIACSLTHHD